MKYIGVICTIIGAILVISHGGRTWYGPNANEKNKEDGIYVFAGIGLIILGGFLMAN